MVRIQLKADDALVDRALYTIVADIGIDIDRLDQ